MRQRRATSQEDDFILDALRHIKPLETVMHQLCQATVELSGTCQNAGRRIHHTLQFVGDDFRLSQHLAFLGTIYTMFVQYMLS